ncbi:hypothetical protein ACQ86E_31105 [Bradyrhizobium betae]|uniref:hypothetical protein n=1 Tax=Bradyrhizobium betae TaxID=244734 RepID=UPI003D67714A
MALPHDASPQIDVATRDDGNGRAPLVEPAERCEYEVGSEQSTLGTAIDARACGASLSEANSFLDFESQSLRDFGSATPMGAQYTVFADHLREIDRAVVCCGCHSLNKACHYVLPTWSAAGISRRERDSAEGPDEKSGIFLDK